MLKNLLILFFVGLTTFIQAQNAFVDSVRKELNKSKVDSMKVHDRIRVSWTLIRIPDSAAVAWKLLHEADSIANKTNNPVLKGLVLEHKGYMYSIKNDKQSLPNYLEALSVLKNYPNSLAAKKSYITANLGVGFQLMVIQNYEEGLNYLFDGMQTAEKLDSNQKDLPQFYANIINCYNGLNKYEAALVYCKKAYAKSKQYSNQIMRFSACGNYAQTLFSLGRKDEAFKFTNEAKAIADSSNDDYMLGKTYEFEGSFYVRDSDYVKGLSDLQKAYEHIQRIQSPNDLAELYIWLGSASMYLKKYDDAKRYQDSAYTLANENDNKYFVRDIFNQKYMMERQRGNAELAFKYLDSSNFWRDSLLHQQNVEKFEYIDAKYQTEKKEATIQQLTDEKKIQELIIKQKNIFNYILIASAILLLLFSFLLYRNYKHKQQLQQQRITELETEKQLTATEAVLKGEEQERTRLAKDLHDGLGGMLSGIKYSLNTMKGNLIMTPDNAQAFERSIDMLDSSIKEMRRVAHNMMPEALVKFGLDTALKDFCTDINQSGALQINYQSIGLENAAIEQTTAITIYRIVQELINNTLKHAAAKNAIVQVSKTDGLLSVTVEDDGKGFDKNILSGTKGIGWSNIENRVEFLKGKLDVNTEPGKGTSVLIEINA